MNMTTDKMFNPLFLHLKKIGVIRNIGELNEKADKIAGQYMFMYTKNNMFYYKHFATRDYIVISSSGKLVSGTIEDPKFYF